MGNKNGYRMPIIVFIVLVIILALGIYWLSDQRTLSTITNPSAPAPTLVFEDPEVGIHSQKLLDVRSEGGLCMKGMDCSTTTSIFKDGSVESNIGSETKDVSKLASLIASTDFAKLREKKFTGTCPIAYDGQEMIYTFYTSSGIETIRSCETEIDEKNPLFIEIGNLLLSQ